MIRVYLNDKKKNSKTLSKMERDRHTFFNRSTRNMQNQTSVNQKNSKKKYRGNPTQITKLKESYTELKPFKVADALV